MTLDKNAHAAISELYEHYEDEILKETYPCNLIEAEDVFTAHESESYLEYCTLIQLAGILEIMGEPVPYITKTLSNDFSKAEELTNDLRKRASESLEELNLHLVK